MHLFAYTRKVCNTLYTVRKPYVETRNGKNDICVLRTYQRYVPFPVNQPYTRYNNSQKKNECAYTELCAAYYSNIPRLFMFVSYDVPCTSIS